MKRIACLLLALMLYIPTAGAEIIFSHQTEETPAEVEPAMGDNGSDEGDTVSSIFFGNTDAPEGESDDAPVQASTGDEGWPRKIVVTVGGDCTLGCTDSQRGREEGFARVIKEKGYDWPFSELVKVFAGDDMTLINFEGTLTESTDKLEGKKFNFKGPAEYAEMLVLGSVEAVNLANNHYGDYSDEGKADTKANLAAYGITYNAQGEPTIYETRGVKIGLIGNTFAYKDGKRDISAHVQELRDAGCQIVIASFHWGSEYEKSYNRDQRNIGRAAVNAGADVIIGHHPHIVQGIEKYEDTYILYSLGNLVFGGNTDPDDRDTYIAQLTFTVYEDGHTDPPELKIIPMRLTANNKGYTDYRPVFAEGEEYDRILNRILNLSNNMGDFVNPQ